MVFPSHGHVCPYLIHHPCVPAHWQTAQPMHLFFVCVCVCAGYGQSGPYRERAGYDVIAASMGGLLHITGPQGGEPCKVGVAITDLATGLYAHGAIMAALLQRTRTGKGQWVNCSLFSTQVCVTANTKATCAQALFKGPWLHQL